MSKKKSSDDIRSIISEIESLQNEVGEFRKGIQKIKDAPKDKDAHVVGQQHEDLVAELEDIAKTLERLPKKWSDIKD